MTHDVDPARNCARSNPTPVSRSMNPAYTSICPPLPMSHASTGSRIINEC